MAGSINVQNHLIPWPEKATSVSASSTEQQESSYTLDTDYSEDLFRLHTAGRFHF